MRDFLRVRWSLASATPTGQRRASARRWPRVRLARRDRSRSRCCLRTVGRSST